MKNKKLFIFSIIIICLILITFLIKNNYNFSKKGNNMSNKSADEIKEYILNIESYKAIAEVTIKSNKNENTYKLEQKYNRKDNVYKQEVLEPENIKGVQFIYDGTNLKVENTKMNLNQIYTNYNYIESNELGLASFIEDYKQSNEAKYIEKNGKVILETDVKKANKYVANKKLYIDKEKGEIEKLEINDITQNTRIYILYNKIEINTLSKEEVLAFSLKLLEQNI